MAKFQIFKKSERKEKYSDINLKKGNPTFLPHKESNTGELLKHLLVVELSECF